MKSYWNAVAKRLRVKAHKKAVGRWVWRVRRNLKKCLTLPQTSEHMTERLVQVIVLLLSVCVTTVGGQCGAVLALTFSRGDPPQVPSPGSYQ